VFSDISEYEPEHDSLEKGFKKRRREVVHSIFLDREKSIIRSSEKFFVNVISDSSESQADRKYGCYLISDKIEIFLVNDGKYKHRKNYSNRSTMEAHSTIPESENFQGIINIVCEIIKKYISEPSSEHDSEKYIHDE
jgi:hypothetical protein